MRPCARSSRITRWPPLYVESSENGGDHKGAVYAVIDQPFNRVSGALRSAPQWCDVLILQANVKHCAAPNGGEAITLFVGRKAADSLEPPTAPTSATPCRQRMPIICT